MSPFQHLNDQLLHQIL